MTYVAFNTYDEHDWRSGNPTYDDLAYEKEFYCRVRRHLLE
jgi:hypothetical protein